jgi:hypothetical protein
VFVEVLVVTFADLGAAARPDRLHGVQRLGFDFDFFGRVIPSEAVILPYREPKQGAVLRYMGRLSVRSVRD